MRTKEVLFSLKFLHTMPKNTYILSPKTSFSGNRKISTCFSFIFPIRNVPWYPCYLDRKDTSTKRDDGVQCGKCNSAFSQNPCSLFSLFYTLVLFSIAFEADRHTRISKSAQPEWTTLALSDIQGTSEGRIIDWKAMGNVIGKFYKKESQVMHLDGSTFSLI